MTRLTYVLKVIRFDNEGNSTVYRRRIEETRINTKRELAAVIKVTRSENRLWVSVTRVEEPGCALWVAITDNHAWITYWPNSESIDLHACNPDKPDAKQFIEFLLDNTQPQMVRESFTFGRKVALDSLGYFVVHGSPPAKLEFSEELDTYC